MSAPQPQKRTTAKPTIKLSGSVIGSVFLGICLLVGSFKIAGALNNLNKTVSNTAFSSTFSSPSDINVELSGVDKKYLTLDESAKYLNMSSDKITSLISAGEITEYIKTDTGYSILIKDLDDWFENDVYERQMQKNAEKIQQNTSGN